MSFPVESRKILMYICMDLKLLIRYLHTHDDVHPQQSAAMSFHPFQELESGVSALGSYEAFAVVASVVMVVIIE